MFGLGTMLIGQLPKSAASGAAVSEAHPSSHQGSDRSSSGWASHRSLVLGRAPAYAVIAATDTAPAWTFGMISE